MPKYAPISYVVQEARERLTKKNTTAGSRTAKQGYAKPTRGNENTAGLGQVTKTGQTKPAQTGRRNHHKFSAWLRKWSQLNQWLEGQGSTPTQVRKHMGWSKVGQPEKSRQRRGTLKLTEQQNQTRKRKSRSQCAQNKSHEKTQEGTQETWLGGEATRQKGKCDSTR